MASLDCDFLDDEEVIIETPIKLKRKKKSSFKKLNKKSDLDCDFID